MANSRGFWPRPLRLGAAILLCVIALAACTADSPELTGPPTPNDEGESSCADFDTIERTIAPTPDAELPAPVSSIDQLDASGPPNIVLIMTDDQNWQSVACMPTVWNRLASNGQTFSNAFVTSPNCCPARAGFFTGDYVDGHGVFTNGLPRGGAEAYTPTGSFPELLQAEGYKTALIGKYLTAYEPDEHGPPTGFDTYLTFDDTPRPTRDLDTNNYLDWAASDDGQTVFYGDADSDYSTDVFGKRTREFIASTDRQPFFLQFSPYAPHRPATLPDRHSNIADRFVRERFPPNYGQPVANGAWTNELTDAAWANRRQPEVEQVRQQQIASLQAVDEYVAHILDDLDDAGQLDNTVVIFTSDNGYSWGEHRWLHKLCPYESCLRVPLVVADFRTTESDGTVDPRLVTNLDLAATIAELANTFDPELMPDARPIDFVDAATPIRGQFLIENYGAGNGARPVGMPVFQGVRTTTHKYARFPDGGEELFDLVNDPYETTNVVGDADLSDTLDELRATTDESFAHELRRASWPVAVDDACIGDGDPITADFTGDLPPVDDILSFEIVLQTEEPIDLDVRRGLDLVAADAGWPESEQIALVPRPLESDTVLLPAATRNVRLLDVDEFERLEIEASVEPAEQACIAGTLDLVIDYIAKK